MHIFKISGKKSIYFLLSYDNDFEYFGALQPKWDHFEDLENLHHFLYKHTCPVRQELWIVCTVSVDIWKI